MRLKVSGGTCSIISSETELTQMRLKYFSVSQVQEEDVAWPTLTPVKSLVLMMFQNKT